MSALTVKYNIFFLNSKSYKTKKVLGVGNCQICASVQNCTTGQKCTKIFLHDDTFARVDKIARRPYYTKVHFCTKIFLHELNFFYTVFY